MGDARTIVFFPEGAFGPTNNCVGIGQVLRGRGHRVVFIVEESFAGTLEAKGFEERLMRLGPPPEEPEVPGQFWIDFIRDTAPVFRKSTLEQIERVHRSDLAGAHRRGEVRQPAARGDHRRGRAGRDRRGQRRVVPGRHGGGAAMGPDRVVQPGRAQGPARRPVLVGLPGRRPLGLAGVPRRVPPRAWRHVGRLRRVLSRARRRWPGRRRARPRLHARVAVAQPVLVPRRGRLPRERTRSARPGIASTRPFARPTAPGTSRPTSRTARARSSTCRWAASARRTSG